MEAQPHIAKAIERTELSASSRPAQPGSMFAATEEEQLLGDQAHKRKIVRHFAPHLSDAALATQERRYFALGLARVLVVFAVPSCVVFFTRDWFVETLVFLVVALVCVVELAMALVKILAYAVWWEEQIAQAEDVYKLKIMGYYIRKIEKFVGRFPAALTADDIKRYYRARTWPLLLLFALAYVACLVLLVQTEREKAMMRTWVFYLLSIGSGLVVLRYAKLHLVELPQVLALRDHPEFATDAISGMAETIPFARPVPSYNTADEQQVVEIDVDTRKNSAQWEEREFQKFRATVGSAQQQQVPYGAYLFGRLMLADLHESCRPVLPPDVAALNGVTIQGISFWWRGQVVDVANIGANFERRTEFSTAGPTRTLKLGLTDGHQLVFGFEFRPLPQLSMDMARGTKIVVENVPVRHGLLMLAPDNCELLDTSAASAGRGNNRPGQQLAETESGAYSAALVTSQFTTSQQQQQPATSSTDRLRPASTQSLAPPPVEPTRRQTNTNSSNQNAPIRTSTSNDAAVFVDVVSSDEDVGSDTTDPTVEHLFYSADTPRLPGGANPSTSVNASKKRPLPPSSDEPMANTAAAPILKRSRSAQAATPSGDVAMDDAEAEPAQSFSFSLLNREASSDSTATTIRPPLDPTRPFQYFTARLASLSASTTTQRLQIRGCIKSVVGFQFHTGHYQLRVLVEDCTATREADVAEPFVARLMGVSCVEFMQAMQTQTQTQVAHGWAASMQFALMNLEGVMTFDQLDAGTTMTGAVPLTLVDCRDFQPTDTRELLLRVQQLSSHVPR
ncbi:hypothetical protein BBJ28_00018028 [Nothophytophthora sp. Chile5]|nr:hypothetical protein BBJ28_00018028 [Nothophytophthora sp. Chile5]